MEDVVIIGAGAAGLAVYYQLKQSGVKSRILDEHYQVASSWRVRHPQLRLNTHRWYSHQPGMRIPAKYGRWVSRDDYIQYLEDYVARFEIPIEFNTRVFKVDRKENSWKIETSQGNFISKHVVISCGANRIPKMPHIPGLETFDGIVKHAADFGEASGYDGKSVLIIGGGNSAFDLGNHLSKRPVRELSISIRTTPGISAKEVFGFPMHLLAAWMRDLPIRIQDALFHSTQNSLYGNLKKFNFGDPPKNVFTKHARDGITVSVDDGFIRNIKKGKARVIDEIIKIDQKKAITAKAVEVYPDVILCATGYDPGLFSLIGHLGVLDPFGIPATTGSQTIANYPGLWFIGLRGYIWGNMYEQIRQSAKLAEAIASDLNR